MEKPQKLDEDGIDQICRSCLSSSTEVQSIFDHIQTPASNISIFELLQEFSITVVENDEFPKFFCMECLKRLVSGYEFLKTWKTSQEILNKQITIADSKDENLETEDEEEMYSEEEDCENDKSMAADSSSIVKTESDLIQFSLVEESLRLNEAYKDKSLDEPDNFPTSESEDEATIEAELSTKTLNRVKYDLATCPMCPQKFSTYASLSYHLNKAHTNAIKCNLCPIISKSAKLFIEHYGICHGYACELCKKSYTTIYTLRKHMRVHFSKEHPQFPCKICHRNFRYLDSWKYHMKTQHDDSFSFTCEVCGMAFKTKINFNYHIKKHDERKFLCPYCGKSFLQSVHLKYHIRGHTGEKPHMCKVCGNKTYATGYGLKNHLKKCGKNKEQLS